MLLIDTVQWLVLLQTACMGGILLFHWLTLSLPLSLASKTMQKVFKLSLIIDMKKLKDLVNMTVYTVIYLLSSIPFYSSGVD